MSLQRSETVAIFWDYENCPAPASTSGYSIANKISSLARSFGSVNMFKAYLEISDQNRSMSVRSELQSSGVSLVDCPHNGRKDVADKMLLVDMLSYAIDNPAPSTILLITGDRDFAYALSVLKNRHYRIVLVKKPDTHVSLTFQACICLDWLDDVVHQSENPISQTEQRPQRQPHQRHRRDSSTVGNIAAPHPLPHSPTEDSIVSGPDTEGPADVLHDRIPDRLPLPPMLPSVSIAVYESPRQDREISSSPTHPGLTRDSTSKSDSVQAKPQHTPVEAQRSQSEPPCTMLPGNALLRHNSPAKALSSTQVSRSADTGDARARITKQTVPKLLEPAKDDVRSSVLPSSPIKRQGVRVMHEVTKSLKPCSSPTTAEELAEKFLQQELAVNNKSPTSPSRINLVIGSPMPSKPTSATTTANIIKPGIKNVASTNAKPSRVSGTQTKFQTVSGPGQITLLPQTPVVPPHFVALVEALQRQRAKGVFTPYRNVIAESVSKKGGTYQRAGVSSFRQYSLLAEQTGIIEMGGKDGRDWIRLMPKWHNVHVVTPISSST